MKTSPTFTVKTGVSGKIIILDGNMFNYTTNVGLFLSSNKFDGTEQYYDLYSNTRTVSSLNPPFSAYPMSAFVVWTNNTLQFTLPAYYYPQHIDIIFANDAGYRLASSGKRFSYIAIVD
jgi:hypothetical protein